jgi:putative ABC transport system substrate-binding protein
MIEDLIKQRASAIATFGPPAAVAAKRASTSIPIVFTVGLDPVAAGSCPASTDRVAT